MHDDTPRLSQKFFAIGKRIPKDVKRHCGMCRQHGIVVETRGHNCAFKACDCSKCALVRQRRSIMSTQIRLRREQDKRFERTNEPAEADLLPGLAADANSCYFCQKCKNHDVLALKKDHKKKCEFANCHCEQCELIETRRTLDRHIKGSRVKAVVDGKTSQAAAEEKMEVVDTKVDVITAPIVPSPPTFTKTTTEVSPPSPLPASPSTPIKPIALPVIVLPRPLLEPQPLYADVSLVPALLPSEVLALSSSLLPTLTPTPQSLLAQYASSELNTLISNVRQMEALLRLHTGAPILL